MEESLILNISVDAFLVQAKKEEFNEEQALLILTGAKFDLRTAKKDLGNNTTFPDNWTRKDKQLFNQYIHMFDINFHKIHELVCALP